MGSSTLAMYWAEAWNANMRRPMSIAVKDNLFVIFSTPSIGYY
jgi:hypothetical protein